MITLKLSVYQSALLHYALTRHLKSQPDGFAGREPKRVCRLYLKMLDHQLANDLALDQKDWPTLSRALRPHGSNPATGSDEAKLYALYMRLIREYPLASGPTRAGLQRKRPTTRSLPYTGGRAGN